MIGTIASEKPCWTNHLAVSLVVLSMVVAAGCSHRLAADGQTVTSAGRLPEIGDIRGDGPPHARELHRLNLTDAEPRVHRLSETGNAPYEIGGRRFTPLMEASGYRATGVASWYGRKFHGQTTSSGEIYDMYQMTAAHRILPLPSYVKITNLDNGKEAVVKVNDRGPFRDDRLIDLSYAAAVKLGADVAGTIDVQIEALKPRGDVASSRADERTSVPAYQMYLQVGAFSDELNAQQFREQLIQAGVRSVEISTHTQDRGILFRVRIGPLPDQQALSEQQLMLSTRFRTEGRVVFERRD